MEQGDKFFTIVSVLIIGVILQVLLGLADARNTPARTAVAFAEAYFNLDPDMGDYVCNSFGDEDPDFVNTYINSRADEARALGFEPNYMRMRLFSPHTRIVSQTGGEAVIHITADLRRNINPIFTLVGKLFYLGETHHLDETLLLVQENGEWKVCGAAFDLSV